MKISKTVSIIIVNFNGKIWLKNCLDSIYKQTYKNIEIIVVDNNSDDNSIEFIEKNYPAVLIHKNPKNTGFGAANNLGVDKSSGEILFFLNNDTVSDANLIENLIDCKSSNNLNIVGPKILDFHGNDIYKDRNLSVDITGFVGWGKDIFYIEGCALMISRRDFEYLGKFDPRYFMYSEDIDLCWRAHIMGMKIGICHKAVIKHYGGGSSSATNIGEKGQHLVPISRRYESEKNNLSNLLKNYSIPFLVIAIVIDLTIILAEALFYLLTLQRRPLLAVLKSIWWNMIQLPNTLKLRLAVQEKRKRSDLELVKKMSRKINKIDAIFRIGIPKYV